MIILSDCLTVTVDEGCIKVANSLTKCIKHTYPDTTIISCGKNTDQSDLHFDLNKLFLNSSLIRELRKRREPLLYIPFSSNTLASIFRACILSMANPEKVTILFALRHPMNALSMFLLRLSGVGVLALSQESYAFYEAIVGARVSRLKAGVDVQTFVPVDKTRKMELRRKYGFPTDKRIVLHVGHLNRGRNVISMCDLNSDNHGVLVLSSVTKSQRDPQVQQALMRCTNVTILDSYLPNIQEIYQLADVYLFPVQEEGACIDIPLSVMEAAACGTPIVCTAYGELKEFIGKPGFYFPGTWDAAELNGYIQTAVTEACNPRAAILEYDWTLATNILMRGE